MVRILAAVAIGAALFSQQVIAACSAPLVIDNFSNITSQTNNLGLRVSDDGSTNSFTASSGTLSFSPRSSDSYFYENIPCQNLSTDSYNGISFDITAQQNSSFVLELQSRPSCASTTYTSTYILVDGVTTSSQTITIPFSRFATPPPNLNGITSFVFGDFSSSGTWRVSNVRFGCDTVASTTSASSTSRSSSSSRSSTSVSTRVTALPSANPNPTCSNYLIDDFESQSRLTFLNYNGQYRSTSDDGTMQSIIVGSPARRRATFTPGQDSYFYSSFPCVDARNKYGGISLRLKAPSGSRLTVSLQSSTACSTDQNLVEVTQTSSQLGWTFDNTERLYSIPFSRYSGLGTGNIIAIVFSGLSSTVTMGPISFYCGNTVSEFTPSPVVQPATPSGTVAITSATAPALVIDTFSNRDSNSLGMYHGEDDPANLAVTWGSNRVTINPKSADGTFYTEVSNSCRDLTSYNGGYLHIAYSGSAAFSVAMIQHNSACNDNIAPYPETWDSIEAARYVTSSGNIYIPMAHFNIIRSRIRGFSLKGFYTTSSTTLTKMEITKTAPSGSRIPEKLQSSKLVFACTRPNSFAFAIDDGIPDLAQEVLKIIREENIKVTFFTVGAPLLDPGTNFTNVYKEMQANGHQIALHSFTHPPMEGLPSNYDIDWELDQDLAAVKKQLGINLEKYFRPPFGTEGARMRQRLAAKLGSDAQIINWSVDVEDYLWAESSTPEKQLDAFQRDVNKGGNLVVMHYLYPSTVSYLRQFIQIAKRSGKQLMRVDQCMQDPNAPPL